MPRYHSVNFLRALGVISMVEVHLAMYLVSPEGQSQKLYEIMGWFGHLAAPIFLISLGISLTLAVNGKDKGGTPVKKRGAALFVLGLLFIPIWQGSILHYMGIYLLVSYSLLGVPRPIRLVIAALLLAGAPVILQYIDYSAGWKRLGYQLADFWTVHGFLTNLLANGFFPVFPWLLYPIFGTVLGDYLLASVRQGREKDFALGCITAGAVFVSVALVLASHFSWEISFYPTTILHVLLFLGVVLLLFGVFFRLLDIEHQPTNIAEPILFLGRVSLSMYILHILVGPVLFRTIGWLNAFSVYQVLAFDVGMVVFLGLFCYRSLRIIGHGPFEYLLRKVSR